MELEQRIQDTDISGKRVSLTCYNVFLHLLGESLNSPLVHLPSQEMAL